MRSTLEETQMTAIIRTKKSYNGNEFQNQEFIDGGSLEFYDFSARTYDQQIGWFIQTYPLIEEGGQDALTPYQFGFNNPIRYNDPDGKFPILDLIPLALKLFAVGAAVDAGTQVVAHKIEGKSWEIHLEMLTLGKHL